MADTTWLGLGCVAFLVSAAVQLAGWARLLARPLRSAAADDRGATIRRWLVFAVGWQIAVVLVAGAYLAVQMRSGSPARAWVAPAAGAVLGNLVPLQLAVATLSRAVRA